MSEGDPMVSLLAPAFVTGASAGVVGDRMLTPQPRLRIATTDMSRVFDRLHPTADQRVRAESIAARSAPRSHTVMLEIAERLRAVADSVDTELRAILHRNSSECSIHFAPERTSR